MKLLLVGMVLAAMLCDSAKRTVVAALLAGLDPHIAFELGACTRGGWNLPSYKTLCKQLKRLERALKKGEKAGDGTTVNLAWFRLSLLAASIPKHVAKQIRGGALDATDVPAWATWTKVDGKIVSADLVASLGYRSGTSTRDKGIFFGRLAHLVVACRTAVGNGDPRKVGFKDQVPPYILDIGLTKAGDSTGLKGVEVVFGAQKIAPNLKQVYADMGYTTKPRFKLPLHKANLDIFMDQPKDAVRRAKTIVVGRGKNQPLVENAGSYFPVWMPHRLLTLPKRLAPKAHAEWYAERSKYAWIVTHRRPDGAITLKCPQCAGRIRTKAKTANPPPRKPRKKNSSPAAPLVAADVKPGEYCCKGSTVTLTAAERANVQPFPYGTPAQKHAYTSRNQSENGIKGLKDENGLKTGWCRSVEHVTIEVGAIMLAVAYNMAIADKPENKEPPRPADPAKTPKAADETATAGEPSDKTATAREPSDDEPAAAAATGRSP